jgi:hypothetical protein
MSETSSKSIISKMLTEANAESSTKNTFMKQLSAQINPMSDLNSDIDQETPLNSQIDFKTCINDQDTLQDNTLMFKKFKKVSGSNMNTMTPTYSPLRGK